MKKSIRSVIGWLIAHRPLVWAIVALLSYLESILFLLFGDPYLAKECFLAGLICCLIIEIEEVRR